jgi:hypothetical protein
MGEQGRMPLLQVRVAQNIVDELYRLVPLLQSHPNFRGGTLTMPDVVRLALSLGVEVLRRDFTGES